MTSTKPTANDHASEYIRLLLDLHRQFQNGQEDSAVADELRDDMDVHWRHLDEGEQNLVDGLSADLYSIGIDRQPVGSLAEDELAEWQRVIDAERWAAALEFLRQHESALAPDKVAGMRGTAWGSMSQHAVAAEFFKEAVRLAPSDATYQILYLNALLRSHEIAQALPLAAQIDRESTDAAMLIKAAHVLVERANELPRDAASPYFKQVIHIVQRANQLTSSVEDVLPAMRVTGFMCLAHCYYCLGDFVKARESIGNALRLDPEHIPAQKWLQLFSQADVAHSDIPAIPLMPPFSYASMEAMVCNIGAE